MRKLGNGAGRNNLIDRPLEGVVFRISNRRRRSYTHNRTSITIGSSQTSKAIRKTKFGFLRDRSTLLIRQEPSDLPAVSGHKTDSRLCADSTISLRGLNSHSFMSRIDQAYSDFLTAHEERIQVAPMKPEGNFHAELL